MRKLSEIDKAYPFEVDGEKFRTYKFGFKEANDLYIEYGPRVVNIGMSTAKLQKSLKEDKEMDVEEAATAIEKELNNGFLREVCEKYFHRTEYNVDDEASDKHGTWIPLDPDMFSQHIECLQVFLQVFMINHKSAFLAGADTNETTPGTKVSETQKPSPLPTNQKYQL